MKSILKNMVIAILVILIILGGYYFWNNQNTISLPIMVTTE